MKYLWVKDGTNKCAKVHLFWCISLSSGSSHPSVHSQCASRNVSTAPVANFAPKHKIHKCIALHKYHVECQKWCTHKSRCLCEHNSWINWLIDIGAHNKSTFTTQSNGDTVNCAAAETHSYMYQAQPGWINQTIQDKHYSLSTSSG